jgi:hypothetical protein
VFNGDSTGLFPDRGRMTGKPDVEMDGRGGAIMTLPHGADYSLTESAFSPFQAEPAQVSHAQL